MAYKIIVDNVLYAQTHLSREGSQNRKIVQLDSGDDYEVTMTFQDDNKPHSYISKAFQPHEVGQISAWLESQLDVGYAVQHWVIEPSPNKRVLFVLEKAGSQRIQEYLFTTTDLLTGTGVSTTDWLNARVAEGYLLDKVVNYLDNYLYLSVKK